MASTYKGVEASEIFRTVRDFSFYSALQWGSDVCSMRNIWKPGLSLVSIVSTPALLMTASLLLPETSGVALPTSRRASVADVYFASTTWCPLSNDRSRNFSAYRRTCIIHLFDTQGTI